MGMGKRLLKWAGALALALVAIVAVGVYLSQHRELSAIDSSAAAESGKREPNVIRFQDGAPQLAALRVHEVEVSPLPLAEPLNARVTYDENVTARVSSPISGRVIGLHAQPGDVVYAGQGLLTLDSPDLAAAVADHSKAVADEVRKKAAAERTRALFEGGVIPRRDAENADADLAQAQAETQRARSRLRNLTPHDLPGGSYALRAPIKGVVADRHVNPGSEVRPDLADPLFVITDPAHLWVIVDLPERNLAKVQVGRPALVEVDAYPGIRFPAVVQYIAETVDPATRRVQVRCSVANGERKLKPEMYAKVTLIADEATKAVRVPNSALVTQGLYSYVFVEFEPHVFRRRQVALSVQDREHTYLSGGVEAGEKVVVSGALLLNAEMLEGT